MPTLQNKSRSISNFEAPIKNRNFRDDNRFEKPFLNGVVDWSISAPENDFNRDNANIRQANTIRLAQVCKHYGIEIDEYNRKLQCPFKFHNDSSPSFTYYPDTNSFYCWGCKNGGGSVGFVSLLEDISKTEAARKLLDQFESEEADSSLLTNSKEKEALYLVFSSIVRGFLKENKTEDAIIFIDKITKAFDAVIYGQGNRVIDINGIKHIINKLEKRIRNYGCQLL